MHCLYATVGQLPALKKAVADRGITDVTFKPPFLGRVVIWCGSEASCRTLIDDAGASAA